MAWKERREKAKGEGESRRVGPSVGELFKQTVFWSLSYQSNHLFLCLFTARFMLGLAGIPSVLMFVGLLFMPETPRWLVYHGKKEKAWKVLKKIRSPEEVRPEFQRIVQSYAEYSQTKMGELIV